MDATSLTTAASSSAGVLALRKSLDVQQALAAKLIEGAEASGRAASGGSRRDRVEISDTARQLYAQDQARQKG